MFWKRLKWIGLAIIVTALSGCIDEDMAPGPIGMSNPASDHCAEFGGRSVGNECRFPDGRTCDEWEFYRTGECKDRREKRERRAGIGMSNPASDNCADLGGETVIETVGGGNQVGMCHLPNGCVCEEWALYRDGVCEPADTAG